jgi:hypothetical protein
MYAATITYAGSAWLWAASSAASRFPDEAVPWLQPLEQVVQSKANKVTSAEGRVFGNVLELRVECENGWRTAPYDLVLAVIVTPWRATDLLR